MRLKTLLKVIFFSLLLISNTVQAQTFNTAVNPRPSVSGYCAFGLDIEIFKGRPAIAFAGESGSGPEYPKFIIAKDSNGTTWSSEYTIDNTVDLVSTLPITLTEANGRPGVFFITDGTPDILYFERADNDTGSSWTGTRQQLHVGSTSVSRVRSKNIKGKPAAVFVSAGTPDTVYYVRALDSNGASWGTPVSVYTGSNTVSDLQIEIINDTPAIALFETVGDEILYITSSDDTGGAWNATVTVASGRTSTNSFIDLAQVDGRPAIAYIRSSFSDSLLYIRADNAAGSAWSASPINIYSPFTTNGSHLALTTMADTPVIFFEWSGANDNFWVKADNTTGSVWNFPTAFSSGNDGEELVMIVDSRNDVHLAYYESLGDSLVYIYGDGPAPAAPPTIWNGSTWSNGTPTSSVDAIIASNTTPGSFTCKDLTINSGFALTIGTGITATIHGDMTNSGNGISGIGNLTFSKSGTTTLSGTAFSVLGTITVNSGCTLTTADKLTLASNATNTGSIGNSAGTISGNVTMQRYIPGKRAFRFLGHPFSTAQALSALTDDIDITGTGGSSNGFTTTTTNNPSAYWFDVAVADNSTAGNNSGWTAFTNTNGVSTNSWDKAELIRILVRGTSGQGLAGGSYTPSAATLDMTGTVNQGTQVITLTKGSGSTFVSCGNPFPSPVDMQNVSKGSNIGANYYVWDATSGAAGAYVTNAFTLSYNLPAFGALFTTASANSNNTLTFEEQDKEATGAGVFKTTAPANWVELYIHDSTTKWDRLLINFDDNAMEVQDPKDGVKLYNPGLDFFTVSKDDERLAVDVRPYADTKSIPLGLTAYSRYNKYVFRTGMFDIPMGTKLFLHDKYLNTKEELKAGFEYWFDVTSDTATQGNNRFEINMVGKTAGILATNSTTPDMQLIPNPAHKEVKVAFKALEGSAQLTLKSVTGQIMIRKNVPDGSGSVNISLQNISAGIYIVELIGDNVTFTQKLIKQ